VSIIVMHAIVLLQMSRVPLLIWDGRTPTQVGHLVTGKSEESLCRRRVFPSSQATPAVMIISCNLVQSCRCSPGHFLPVAILKSWPPPGPVQTLSSRIVQAKPHSESTHAARPKDTPAEPQRERIRNDPDRSNSLLQVMVSHRTVAPGALGMHHHWPVCARRVADQVPPIPLATDLASVTHWAGTGVVGGERISVPLEAV
jgi:hypothetical protein